MNPKRGSPVEVHVLKEVLLDDSLTSFPQDH